MRTLHIVSNIYQCGHKDLSSHYAPYIKYCSINGNNIQVSLSYIAAHFAFEPGVIGPWPLIINLTRFLMNCKAQGNILTRRLPEVDCCIAHTTGGVFQNSPRITTDDFHTTPPASTLKTKRLRFLRSSTTSTGTLDWPSTLRLGG
jgi:hypothetical protein